MFSVEEEQEEERNKSLFLEKAERVEEVEEENSVLEESFNETESIQLEEHDPEHRNQEEIISEVTGEEEEEVTFNYLDNQVEIILSNYDRKIMWDKYKNYVDGAALTGLLDATLCR